MVLARNYSSITGIDQVTKPVVGVSSGNLIAQKRATIQSGSSQNGSPFTPVFFRSNGPNTTSSGGPLLACPPIKTFQDPGVPVARAQICYPGGRVVG